MKKAKILAICIGAFLVLLTTAVIVWKTYSFSAAVHFANLNTDAISYVEQLDIDSNGDEFCVFQTRTSEGNLALVYATRDKLGFWHIDRIKRASATPKYTSLAWVEGAGIRRFSHVEVPTFEQEWHFVYCGDDAIKSIELLPGQLPDNSTVNIQQTGKTYLIHLIVFSSEELDLDMLNLRELLIQSGCIAA